MRRVFCLVLLCSSTLWAARKPHVISFGKPMQVQWFTGPDQNQPQPISIRPLYVDSHLKEFTTGDSHPITDRTFVVRQAYRINDELPDESKNPQWKWQRGGWLLVNKETGHVSTLKLPEYDEFYSAPSWYRDYVAYCGVNSDGDRLFAVVAEIGTRKPLLREELGGFKGGDQPDSACAAPQWQREPTRVTFAPPGLAALSFDVRGQTVAPVPATEASPAKPAEQPGANGSEPQDQPQK
jgi:hypothetical protein